MYKFVHEDKESGVKIEYTIEAGVFWEGLVNHFQNFLRGCDFSFFEGMEFSEILADEQQKLLNKERTFAQAQDSSKGVRSEESTTGVSY